MIESLEWLRPGWLLALPVGFGLLWVWWRACAGAGLWRNLVDPELLAHLVGRAPVTSVRSALGVAGVVLVLVCVALAGPTWRAQPAPLYRDLSARIVVLDLSPSMDAVDVKPSRLERARAAIVTILRESADTQLGLVVFGADAFTVAPLMNDASALLHLLGSLGTATLPRAGARPDLGLDLARVLLARAGIAAGDVILVGDSAGDARTLEAAHALAKAGFPLSVLAVGMPHGGPVRLATGALARTESGDILVSIPDLAALERIAHAGGGRFHSLDAGEAAPRFARGAQAWAAAPEAPQGASNLRQDDGVWLVLLVLPFAALLFRRGWLAGFAVLALALPPQQTQAQGQPMRNDWDDLWRRADQQAAAQFASGKIVANAQSVRIASRLGPESPWVPMLLYRSGNFAEAAALFARSDTADAHYNRGNALALEGRLEAALAAYAAALERSPAMRDAFFNRALVREMLAKRRAQPQGGGPGMKSGRPDAALPSVAQKGQAKSQGELPIAGRGSVQTGEAGGSLQAKDRADTAQSQAQAENGARRPEESLEGAELRRLEGLLAEVPDDPGTLLANRFAWQLRLRGARHQDAGARW